MGVAVAHDPPWWSVTLGAIRRPAAMLQTRHLRRESSCVSMDGRSVHLHYTLCTSTLQHPKVYAQLVGASGVPQLRSSALLNMYRYMCLGSGKEAHL